MARKTSGESESSHGFNDIIGLVLLVAALLLLCAQLSFDRYDLKAVRIPPNESVHNLIGPAGAYVAHAFFFVFGATAYFIPLLLVVFGISYIPDWLRWMRLGRITDATSHFRERWVSHVVWAVVLLIALCGLLHRLNSASLMKKLGENIGAPSIGGGLGFGLYEFGFWILGSVG